MSPPVLVGRDFRARSVTEEAVSIVTKDRASMRGFVLGCLACLVIVGVGLYAYALYS